MKKQLLFLFTISALNSCNFSANANYENEKVEKENAESVIATFYLYTERNEFDKITELFGNSFFKVSSKDDLKNFLLDKKNNLGSFEDFILIDWKTNRVTGTNPKTEYLFKYQVKYSNNTAIEIIALLKENNVVKIIGYTVQNPKKKKEV